jgi:hypothetical protein
MLIDSQLVFAQNLSLAVANQSVPSPSVIDLAGVGAGNAPPNYTGVSQGAPNRTFGEDIGIGDGVSPPKPLTVVGAAFAGAGATLQVLLQASVDSGPNGAPPWSPDAWQTIDETPTMTAAQLGAGAIVPTPAIAPRALAQGFPRFYRHLFVVAGTFTAGSIAFDGIVTGVDGAPIYPRGY